ncbi:hypothetical protein QZH41_005003 [Actinostola sp. cb2023]|nr:hypothetical protein QZH41_005003 [Actinostola sp. cb2023]
MLQVNTAAAKLGARMPGLVGCGNPGKPKRGYRVGNDFSTGATVEYFCDSGLRMVSGTRLRTCSEHGKWSGTLPRCRVRSCRLDINECVEYDQPNQARARSLDVQRYAARLCHPHATCINSIGSFQCKCNLGYHGDGRECYPKDLFGTKEFLTKSKTRLNKNACGTIVSRNTSRIRRIVGGDISDHGKTFLFNGALIKPGWVLTIANVLRRRGRPVKPKKLRVILGELNTAKKDGSEISLRVKRIIVHPGYSRYNFSNNIALLQLVKPVKLNNFVRTVCIPRKKKDSRLEKPPNYVRTQPGKRFPLELFNWRNRRRGVDSTCLRLYSHWCSILRSQHEDSYVIHAADARALLFSRARGAKSCGDPGTPLNGRRVGYVFTFKNKVYYECYLGYVRLGPEFRQCQSNQKWSDDTPTCEPADCGRLPAPQYGEKIEETKRTYQGRVTFQCKKEGYELKGSRQRVCQSDGRWDGTLTTCKPPCLDPDTPKGGRRHHHSFLHNNVVRFSCNKGWKMNGEHTIECTDGKWDHSAPKCLASCSDPGPIQHGQKIGKICNNPRSPGNGYKRGKRVSLSGDKVTFYCDSKYDLVGSKEMFCDKGRWNGSVPRCIGRCRVPNYFGKVMTDSVALRSGDWIKHDTKLTFYCNFGQELVGGNETVCSNGHWSNVFPECKVPCNAPDAIPNGRKQGSKFKVEFECNPGHTLDGPSTIHCVQGMWSESPPRCLGNCKDFGDIINGKKTVAGYRHGDRTSFECKDGYRLEGVCKILDTPQNVEMLNNNFDYGATIRFICKDGFSLRGPRNLTCNNGKWSNKVPVCRVVFIRTFAGSYSVSYGSTMLAEWVADCIDPGAPKDGQRQADYFSHDSVVNFSCNNGLMLIGSSRIRCSDGRWTNRKPVCEDNIVFNIYSTPSQKTPFFGSEVPVYPGRRKPGKSEKRMSFDWFKRRNHGIYYLLTTRYKIIVGDHNTRVKESTEQEQFPVEVHVHPGYRHAPYYDNDIALVKLNQSVNLSPYVRTVCLPMTNEYLAKPVQKDATAVKNLHGEGVELKCRDGFDTFGIKELMCRSENWKIEIPVCKEPAMPPPCTDPGVPDGGVRVVPVLM